MLSVKAIWARKQWKIRRKRNKKICIIIIYIIGNSFSINCDYIIIIIYILYILSNEEKGEEVEQKKIERSSAIIIKIIIIILLDHYYTVFLDQLNFINEEDQRKIATTWFEHEQRQECFLLNRWMFCVRKFQPQSGTGTAHCVQICAIKMLRKFKYFPFF